MSYSSKLMVRFKQYKEHKKILHITVLKMTYQHLLINKSCSKGVKSCYHFEQYMNKILDRDWK